MPQDVRTWLIQRVATYLRRDAAGIDTAQPLTEYGLNSLTALAISADAEDEFGLALDPALTWDHPSIDALAVALTTMIEEKLA
jgi:acyl carrier protein